MKWFTAGGMLMVSTEGPRRGPDGLFPSGTTTAEMREFLAAEYAWICRKYGSALPWLERRTLNALTPEQRQEWGDWRNARRLGLIHVDEGESNGR